MKANIIKFVLIPEWRQAEAGLVHMFDACAQAQEHTQPIASLIISVQSGYKHNFQDFWSLAPEITDY